MHWWTAQLWRSHRPIWVPYPFILGCIMSGKLPSSHQPRVCQSIVCWPDEVCQQSTSGPSYSFFFSLGWEPCVGENERSYEEDKAEKPKQAGAVLCCSEEVLPTVVQVGQSCGRVSLSAGAAGGDKNIFLSEDPPYLLSCIRASWPAQPFAQVL